MSNLSETVNSAFANYYEKLRIDLHTWVASLTEEQFWKNPFPYGNSVGHLVLHLTGNLNYYIGAQIAETAASDHTMIELTGFFARLCDQLLDSRHRQLRIYQ